MSPHLLGPQTHGAGLGLWLGAPMACRAGPGPASAGRWQDTSASPWDGVKKFTKRESKNTKEQGPERSWINVVPGFLTSQKRQLNSGPSALQERSAAESCAWQGGLSMSTHKKQPKDTHKDSPEKPKSRTKIHLTPPKKRSHASCT